MYVGRLIRAGLDPLTACRCAISQTLSDEREIVASVEDIAKLYFGDLMPPAEQPEPVKTDPDA